MHLLHLIIGYDKTELSWWQETDRATVIFVLGLIMLRASGLRTFSRFSPLDTVVTIIIGSNLSRALTGSAPFVPTIVASFAFVLLHRALAQAVLHSRAVGRILKGEPRPLVVDGALQPDAMRKEAITPRDLEEALRLRGLSDLHQVRGATLERNGSISIRE